MARTSGVYYRVRKLSSGRKVKITYSSDGRILEKAGVKSRVRRTRTGKRLAQRLRRIHR